MDDVVIDAQIDEAALDLRQFLQGRDVVWWVGSGVSTDTTNAAGQYPSWRKLMMELCEACGVEFKQDTPARLFPSIAKKCKSKSLNGYRAKLGERFGGPPMATPKKVREILNLAKYFVITTNYDHCLLQGLSDRGQPQSCISYPMLRMIPGMPCPFIVHLHGLAPDSHAMPATNLVLSEDEFDAAYDEDPATGEVRRFLSYILPDWSLLLVAYKLDEHETEILFQRMALLRDQLSATRSENAADHEEPKWCMLYPRTPPPSQGIDNESRKEIDLARDKEEDEKLRFAEAGISKFIEYPRVTKQHINLLEVLRRANLLPPVEPGKPGLTAELEAGEVMPGE